MKMKELLTKIMGTGFSKSTMRKILLGARNQAEADKMAEMIDRCKTEEEILAAIATMETTETKAAPDASQE